MKLAATILATLATVAPAKPEKKPVKKPESRHHKAHRLCSNEQPKWCVENAILHNRWMTPGHRWWMRATPACESTYNATASSAGNLGAYQFRAATWATTPYARRSIWQMKWQTFAAAWMLRQGRASEWPNCP